MTEIPVTKKTDIGFLLLTTSGHADDLTILQWRDGKSLAWDVTVPWPLAQLYVSRYTMPGVAAADLAAARKSDE